MNPRTTAKSLPVLCLVSGMLVCGSEVGSAKAAVPPSLPGGSIGVGADGFMAQAPRPRSAAGIRVAGGFGRRGFGGHAQPPFAELGVLLPPVFGGLAPAPGYGYGYGVYAPGYTYREGYVAPHSAAPKKTLKRQAASGSKKHASRQTAAAKPAARLTRSVATEPVPAAFAPPGMGFMPTGSRGVGGGAATLGDATGGGRATFRTVSGGGNPGLGDSTGGGRATFRASPGGSIGQGDSTGGGRTLFRAAPRQGR
jgi:hypothetical protein